jgi:Cu(I)/Ag(I) efflux system membrane fusion protein
VLSVRLRFIALLVAILAVAASWNHVEARIGRALHGRGPASVPDDEYFCPMHLAVVRDEAGKCPSCGMPLSVRKRVRMPGADGEAHARIQLSPLRIQQAGIRTSVVERRPLELEIDAPGVIRYD